MESCCRTSLGISGSMVLLPPQVSQEMSLAAERIRTMNPLCFHWRSSFLFLFCVWSARGKLEDKNVMLSWPSAHLLAHNPKPGDEREEKSWIPGIRLFLSLSRVSRPQGRPLEEEKENLFQLTGQKLIRKVEREKRKRIRVYAPQELD